MWLIFCHMAGARKSLGCSVMFTRIVEFTMKCRVQRLCTDLAGCAAVELGRARRSGKRHQGRGRTHGQRERVPAAGDTTVIDGS
jgi:hypothetical protein